MSAPVLSYDKGPEQKYVVLELNGEGKRYTKGRKVQRKKDEVHFRWLDAGEEPRYTAHFEWTKPLPDTIFVDLPPEKIDLQARKGTDPVAQGWAELNFYSYHSQEE